jgi:hypothetical protein
MNRPLMTLAAVAGCSLGWLESASLTRGQDAPASPPPVYWTFPAYHDFLELDAPDQSANDPFDPTSPSREPPKSVRWDENPTFFQVGSIFDAAPLLRKVGIPFQEGKDLAFFHKADQRLYVRCSRESADLIDQFTGQTWPDRSRNLEIDIVFVGLNDASLYRALAGEDDPRMMAESLATDKGRVIARASLLTRSGQRAALGQVGPEEAWPASAVPVPADKAEKELEKPKAERSPGLRLEVEPTLGADGNTIDLTLDCSFGLRPGPAERPLITGRLATAVTVSSGHPLLQRLSLEGAPWPEAVVILTATIKSVYSVDWKNGVPQLTPREKRWRELGAKPE